MFPGGSGTTAGAVGATTGTAGGGAIGPVTIGAGGGGGGVCPGVTNRFSPVGSICGQHRQPENHDPCGHSGQFRKHVQPTHSTETIISAHRRNRSATDETRLKDRKDIDSGNPCQSGAGWGG